MKPRAWGKRTRTGTTEMTAFYESDREREMMFPSDPMTLGTRAAISCTITIKHCPTKCCCSRALRTNTPEQGIRNIGYSLTVIVDRAPLSHLQRTNSLMCIPQIWRETANNIILSRNCVNAASKKSIDSAPQEEDRRLTTRDLANFGDVRHRTS